MIAPHPQPRYHAQPSMGHDPKDEWAEDEPTMVGSIDLAKQALAGSARDRAYVIVIAGPNVGEMFKVEGAQDIGRSAHVPISIRDSEISRQHARLVVRGGAIFVEDLGSTNGTFVNGERVTRRELEDGDKIQVGTTTILKFSYHDHLDERFQRQMYDAALRDGLTGAYNKKYFLERLEAELAYAVRHRSALCLLFFDLDHFKAVNDTHGHLAGDAVLRTLAAGVLHAIRREDIFARYGGEEFALLSRGIDMEGGRQFAERIREWIANYPFEHEGTFLPVTASIGVAAVPELDVTDPDVLMQCADDALYAAKEAGRNRVVLASDGK